jgi:hypothetical protein
MVSALQVRGPFRGPSGYDHHTRELVRALVRLGVAVELVDVPEWGPVRLADDQREPWFDTLGAPTGAPVSLQIVMPHQVRVDPSRLTVNYTMFEATRISPAWVQHGSTHDLIVLATASSRRAWIESGVPAAKLRLCPLGIDPAVYGAPATPMALWRENGVPIERYQTRFLNVSSSARARIWWACSGPGSARRGARTTRC